MPQLPATRPEPLPVALAENLITLLCFDDVNGRVVAGNVEANLFDNEIHRTIVTRALTYWRDHKRAPKLHIGDVLADILEDEEDTRGPTFRQTITNMAQTAYDPALNPAFVLDWLKNLQELASIKRAILTSAERIQARQDIALPEVKKMWREILSTQNTQFDKGMTLAEFPRVLDFIAKRAVEFRTGIIPLDEGGIIPAREAVYVFLGGPGRGKTWFLIQVGKNNFRDRKKILHLTLELVEEQVAMRYYQALFALPRHKLQEDLILPRLQIDRFKRFGGISNYDATEGVPFTLDSADVSHELYAHLSKFGRRVDENLIIKGFPGRSLDVAGIEAYLDGLELAHGFVPDMVILDYYGLMKTTATNHRIELGRSFEEFRGLMVKRKMAGVTAQQLSKKGAESLMAGAKGVAEDYSIVGTADTIVVYSATDNERNLGLGRVFVDKAREAADKWGALLTQAYEIGQFSLEAVRLPKDYFEYLRGLDPVPSESEDDDEDTEDQD